MPFDYEPGTIVEANDGSHWFKGDLGWYEARRDSYLDAQEEVPTGIANVTYKGITYSVNTYEEG